jgi:hypothetical protein
MMMKKLLRKISGLLVLLLFVVLISGCGGTESGDATDRPAANLEESVQQTLTSAAATTGPETTVEPDSMAVSTEIAGIDCSLPEPTDKDWPVLLCETFDDNSHDWIVESQDNPYARYSIDVEAGKYALSYTAKGFASFQRTALTWFDVASAEDFALSVTTLMNSDFQNCSWGVAFRGDDDSFFLFSIYNDNTYVFEIYENDGWIPLISQRPYDGILSNTENKLNVIAEGGDFTFYINDELVNAFSGGLLQGSQIFLVVSAGEGVTAEYSFDDVVMQVRQ